MAPVNDYDPVFDRCRCCGASAPHGWEDAQNDGVALVRVVCRRCRALLDQFRLVEISRVLARGMQVR
jgi:hypothetical protein